MTISTGTVDYSAMCAEFGLNPASAVFPRDFYGKAGAPGSGTLDFLWFRGKSGAGGFAPVAGTYSGDGTFTISSSTAVVWTYTKTGAAAGTASIASGASATSITFSITPPPIAGNTRSSTFSVQASGQTWNITVSATNTSTQDPCVQMDSPILLAGGSEKMAADIVPGDMVWTRHEETMEWGAFPVEAISFHLEPLFAVPGHPVTSRGHRFALPAFLARHLPARMRWWRSHWLGRRIGMGMVARITVGEAHTYVARNPAPGSKWRLSHNVKQ